MATSKRIFGQLSIGLLALISGTLVSIADTLPPPLTDNDFRAWQAPKALLGRSLFYDKILSGNRNIACSTCHHPKHASADGLSLGIGEGGVGLGPDRSFGTGKDRVSKRVPRNAPALFNLGAKEFTVLFHDGRLSVDPEQPGGFNSPAEEFLPTGLNSILAAQALFPLLSTVEMAGDHSENEVAGASRRSPLYSWRIIAERVANTANYWPLFKKAWPELTQPSEMNITHIANAIDDFINAEWRADNSAFDHYLRGEKDRLSDAQKAGMELFYGPAGCSGCHSGQLQTDHKFYALGLPPFGPGRTRAFDPIARDQGRINETDFAKDAYYFRTPSLRNVEATGPWGHNGAFATLQGIIKHHLDADKSLANYDKSQLILRSDKDFTRERDFIIWQDSREMQRLQNKTNMQPVQLDDQQILQLVHFLSSLTDQDSIAGLYGEPESVPSQLPLDR